MKRLLLTAVIALALCLAWATTSYAADLNLQIYGEYGFGYTSDFGPLWNPDMVTPYTVGGKCDSGRFVIGGEYIGREVTDTSLPPDSAVSKAWDAYAGYALLDTEHFDLYGLLGYAGIQWDASMDIPAQFPLVIPIDFVFFEKGVMAGAGAKFDYGRFVLNGRLLCSVGATGGVSYYALNTLIDREYYDSITFYMADVEANCKITDTLGIYGAFRYLGAVTDLGDRYASWFAAGISLSL